MNCEQTCQVLDNVSDKGSAHTLAVHKMHSISASRTSSRLFNRLFALGVSGVVACVGLMVTTRGLQDAVANGETRTISIYHTHTKESATITFRRNGSYDRDALEKLNWMLRDWRTDEKVTMDPRLFDIAWEAHREVGSSQPFHVVSAYRSPNTNAMLRSRSRGVAKHSQHMQGKAMDFYLPDADMSRVRAVGMRLQRGGVGYYPSAFNPFVHLDAGSVRSWPRMSRDQLARLFPDGRTVHLPADGKPMAGYQEARASILSRGGAVAGFGYSDADEGAIMSGGSGKGLWASLFGGDEDVDAKATPTKGKRGRDANTPRNTQVAAYAPSGGDDAGTRGFYSGASSAASSVTSSPVIAESKPIAPKPAPVVVAALSPALQDTPQKTEAGVKQTAAEKAIETSKPRLITLAAVPTPRPSDLKSFEAVKVASLIPVQLPPVRPANLSAEPVNVALKGSVQEEVQVAPNTVTTLTQIAHPLPPQRPSSADQPMITASAAPLPTAAMVRTVLPPVRDRAQLEALAMQTASIPTQPAMRSQGVKPLFSANPIAPQASAAQQTVIKQAKAKKLEAEASRSLSVVGALDKPLAVTRFQPALKTDASQTFSGETVRSLASSGFEKL